MNNAATVIKPHHNDHHHPPPFMKFLNQLVLEEEKIVTTTYILRRTPLNTVQAQELFKAFLIATNKTRPQVNATYYLLGSTKEAPDKKQCSIVRSEELEKAKQQLGKIHICNIFSVQAHRIESLETLFNVDWMDDDENDNDDDDEGGGLDLSLFKSSFLKCSEAEKAYQKWCKIERAKKKKSLPIMDGDREISRKNEKLQQNSISSNSRKRGPPKPILMTDENQQNNKENVFCIRGSGDENRRGSMGTSSSSSVAALNNKRSAPYQIRIPENGPPKIKSKQPQKKGRKSAPPLKGGGKQTNLFDYFNKR